jgi:ubiquinone/menaquinone biosynthesis C-methylase UbiE
MDKWLLVVFVVLWAVTFIPAWKLLIKLLAMSVADSPLRFNFIVTFIIYRLIIALPYLVLLIFGQNIPGFINGILVGILVLGLGLSFVRFFFKDKAAVILWGAYSYVYDGLLSFYPYENLINLVCKRIDEQKPAVILDAGCGTGNLSQKLAIKYPNAHIISIDSDPRMIKKAMKKLNEFPNIEIHNLGIHEYLEEYPKTKFDAVALVNVLYALDNRQELWESALSSLKTGGQIIVTNSDRKGSWPIIREHLQNASAFQLLRPKLIGVFLVDLFISQLAVAGKFHFIKLEKLQVEIKKAGGTVHNVSRCYGGPVEGVNLLFTVTSKQ